MKVEISENDLAFLLRIIDGQISRARKREAKDIRAGWTPKPGCRNANTSRAEHLECLAKKLAPWVVETSHG